MTLNPVYTDHIKVPEIERVAREADSYHPDPHELYLENEGFRNLTDSGVPHKKGNMF